MTACSPISPIGQSALRWKPRDRGARAGRGTGRIRGHRHGQARQPRAQLFVRRRPALAVRSRRPCRGGRATMPGEAAVRIGRRVIELLQKRTEDGYVARVDLRLRPSPEVTPIVLPVDAAISHYESLGFAVGARRLHPRSGRGRRHRARRSASSTRSSLRVAALARLRGDRGGAADYPRGSATILRKARRSAQASTSSAGAAGSARSSSSSRSSR